MAQGARTTSPTPSLALLQRLTLGLTLLLLGTGFVVQLSLRLALESSPADQILSRLGLLYLAGVMVLLGVALLPLPRRLVVPLTWLVYLVALVLSGLVFSPLGRTVHGASRWVVLGGISFQPSELLRPAAALLTIPLALTHRRQPRALAILCLLLAVAIIGVEPDLAGATLTLAFGSLGLVLGGVRLWRVALIWLVLGTVGVGLVFALPGRFGHARERIEAWFHREELATGAGYQTTAARRAIQAGGLTGRGFTLEVEPVRRIPFVENDFIAAYIGYTFGSLGILAVALLYGLLAVLAVFLYQLHPDPVVGSMGAMAGWLVAGQAAVNLMTTLGVLPPTGITLPFISAGGTSLLVSAALLGAMARFATLTR